MILVENILKKYNAIGINIPKFMIKWMRSNHAGETGAVWIYKGASRIFWNKKILKMSKEHILTETNHLIVMENLLTSIIFFPIRNLSKFGGIFNLRFLFLIITFFTTFCFIFLLSDCRTISTSGNSGIYYYIEYIFLNYATISTK